MSAARPPRHQATALRPVSTKTQGASGEQQPFSSHRREMREVQLALQEANLVTGAAVVCGTLPLTGCDVHVKTGADGTYMTGLAPCRCNQ